MSKRNESKDKIIRAQIPLLDDVAEEINAVPGITDLFGEAEDIPVKTLLSTEHASTNLQQDQIKEQASRMIDSLVRHYSTAVLRCLRDDLSDILDEFDR